MGFVFTDTLGGSEDASLMVLGKAYFRGGERT